MKILKLFILFTFAVIINNSCLNDTSDEMNVYYGYSQDITSKRSFEEALNIAQSALGMLESKYNDTRAIVNRRVSLKDTYAINKVKTRTAIDNDTLMYVFNFEDSLGFAIVSARKNTTGLIAVAEYGYYNPQEEQKNKAFSAFMGNAEQYILNKISAIRDTFTLVPDKNIVTIFEYNVPARIPTKWGQRDIYGRFCPNGIAGCAPIAVAQVVAYASTLDTLQLTYDNRDLECQIMDWDDILKHKLYYEQNGQESFFYCTASDSAHLAIGRFCRQLGWIMNSEYKKDATSTSPENIIYCLRYLGFPVTNYQAYQSKSTTQHLLKNNQVLLFGGFTNKNEGHAWLVDGLYWLKQKVRLADTVDQLEPQYQEIEIIYNHVNWGQNGSSDGFYLDDVFDLDNYKSLDKDHPYEQGHGHNFTEELQFIVIEKTLASAIIPSL